MKYKIIGGLACLLVLAVAVVVPFLADEVPERVHQHLDAPEKAACGHGDDCFCTHLPLVLIDTGGAEIPGKAQKNTEGRTVGYTMTEDGQNEVSAQMRIVDNPTSNNHEDDPAAMESRILINVRGRSSREFDKSGYSVRLIDGLGENNPQQVMGMDAHHEWALHGPYLDKTLIRNYMWYNIAGEIMDYAPNVRFCEVMINGEYMGLYVMMETITAGNDGARLTLSVNRRDNEFSGYLIEAVGTGSREVLQEAPEEDSLDEEGHLLHKGVPLVGDGRNVGSEIKKLDLFTQYSYRSPVEFEIVYPGTKNLTEEMRDEIEQDVSDFQKALYSYDYDNEKYGYDEYIDIESFVDFFLFNEFTCNYDAGWLSTFIYKDLDGKYRTCIWDFNSACDNYWKTFLDSQEFQMQNCVFYYMLFKDEDFVARVIDRYWELRETVFSRDYLFPYIDSAVEYLGPAIERNYEKWGYTFGEEYDFLHPEERNPRSYEESIEQLKEFLNLRIEWMNRNINTLRQYCVESKVKKFNENAN